MKLASLVLGVLSVLTLATELPAQAPAANFSDRQPQATTVSVPIQTVGWRARAYRRGWVGPYAYGAYYRPYYPPRYYGSYAPGAYYYGPGAYGGYGYY
jgi:hypothetical protein